ncbi:FmdB family zinc ribbon protein [Phytomonospora sp. NPDC050363]|uniref:FmdB family zinc ribbon protein n=1 Tax=Phytomonospora sp. NPDC050363 TaxID=3155642 RepID=UPI0033E072AB
MPTYQYACTKCGDELEAVQKFTDEPLKECPTCSGDLRKVFSAVGVVFKGSGFYRTDNRTNSSKESSKSTSTTETKKSDSGSGSSGSTPAKSESKPAAESKPKAAANKA